MTHDTLRNARRIALEMAAAPMVDEVLEAPFAGRVDGTRRTPPNLAPRQPSC
ncbi:MAG TPA: hypothetical protein VFH30_19155 [Acidimicrobiales bacterium]|nr:hypothetical protein [Acidimicrobiales bacterium]